MRPSFLSSFLAAKKGRNTLKEGWPFQLNSNASFGFSAGSLPLTI